MTANTIVLQDGGVHEEGILDTAASPGMNIVLADDGKFDPGAGVASATLPCIVKESSLEGKTVDDEIAIGALAPYLIPRRGQLVQILIKDAEDLDIGELVKANTAGLFVATATAPAQFRMEEALVASGNTLAKARAL
jgi:hypothetical protein